jgi:hypothetical protein
LASRVDEKNEAIQRVTMELSSVRSQKRQLEDDIEYMNNNFTVLSQ